MPFVAARRGVARNVVLNDLSLAARNIARQRRRSAFALAAIAFGVAALIVANGFIDWILFKHRETTITSQFGHIQVTRKGYFEEGKKPAPQARGRLGERRVTGCTYRP